MGVDPTVSQREIGSSVGAFSVITNLRMDFLKHYWLVIIESSLGFNQCFTVLVVGSRIRSLCLFSPFNAYFVGILNRLLNVGIVIYRCVFVLLW